MSEFSNKNDEFFSDMERIESFTEEEIERQAEEDEENPPTDEAFWADAVALEDLPKLFERRKRKEIPQ